MSDYDVIAEIRRPDFHAINFSWNGREYSFAGWWIVEWGDGDHEYAEFDTKEAFLAEPMFNGKTFAEVLPDMTDIDITLEA